MEETLLLPTLPLDQVGIHSRVAIACGSVEKGKEVSKSLLINPQFTGKNRPQLFTGQIELDAGSMDWEKDLSSVLFRETRSVDNVTVSINNLNHCSDTTLGCALTNVDFYGLSLIIEYNMQDSHLSWLDNTDFIFLRDLSDYHKKLVWQWLGGILFGHISFEEFSELVHQYSEKGQWVIVNLIKTLKFNQHLYCWKGEGEPIEKPKEVEKSSSWFWRWFGY